MPAKDNEMNMPSTEKNMISITISQKLVVSEDDDKYVAKLPYTFDPKLFMEVAKSESEEVAGGKIILAKLQSDKEYVITDQYGAKRKQSGQSIFEKYFEPVNEKVFARNQQDQGQEVSHQKAVEETKQPDKQNQDQEELHQKQSEEAVQHDEAKTKSTPKQTAEIEVKTPKIATSAIAPICNNLELKVAKLQDKNTKLSGKVNKNKSRIERWTGKADDAKKAAQAYEALVSTYALPAPVAKVFETLAKQKKDKAASLEDKIERKENKNTKLNEKISTNDKKISKHNTNIERIAKLDKFIQNMKSADGRKENFVTGLQDFRKSSLERAKKKLSSIEDTIYKTQSAFDKTHSAEEKVKLRNKLHSLEDRKVSLEDKISKLEAMNNKLKAVNLLPEAQAERVVSESCENITAAFSEKQNLTPSAAVDTVLDVSEQAIDKHFSEIREKPSRNVEDKIKENVAYDTYNMMSSEQPVQDLPSFQDLHDIFDTPTEHEEPTQSKNVFDTSLFCSTIVAAFNQSYNAEAHRINIGEVVESLSQKFNINDVKSAVAININDRKSDKRISPEALKWAESQTMTETIKECIQHLGTDGLLIDVHSGFLDAFAKRADTLEQQLQKSSEQKPKGVFDRSTIKKNADIISEKQKQQSQQPQDRSASQKHNHGIE